MCKTQVYNYLLSFLFISTFSLFISCTDDDTNTDHIIPESEDPVKDTENETDNETDEEPDNTDPELAGTAEFINSLLVDDSYILMNDAASGRAYIMNKNAEILHEWNLTNGIGNDAYLLSNGKLLTVAKSDDPKILYGGKAGILQIVDKDSTVEWDFEYSSENYIIHHDAEILPNGNIITLVWERKKAEEAKAEGSILEIDIFPEAIIEIEPLTKNIVWEWHAWDHIIQDEDESKNNYGTISENPQLININYVTDKNGDIMHANGITYDEENDLIYLSVNFYHEIWVIDHSTTTEQAAVHSGGNHDKGGDLIYRFGNPGAYNNNAGEKIFDNNLYPNLLKGEDTGKMLVFSNGNKIEQSTVYELQLPEHFNLLPNIDNEPDVIWSFTHPELFSSKVSGAVRLPNGNTLITEGDYGIWEVTENGEVVWKFHNEGFFWRAYHYDENSSEILAIGL